MRNAIGLIKKDLQRHKISMLMPGTTQGKGRSFFLILVTAKTSLLADLKNTYGKEVTAVHLKLAKKIFGEAETENIYGVLVNQDLQMLFAFNRLFADYDRKSRMIVFKDIDGILMDRVEAKKKDQVPTIDLSGLNAPPRFEERRRFPDCGGMHVMIKYSLVEKKKP
jgi:hypothetical protein